MAKRRKNEGFLESTMEKSRDMMAEVGTELGLTEQPKVSRKRRAK